MLEAAKAAVLAMLCPTTRRALGYAPRSDQSGPDDSSDHERSFVHRRLHLPLNAAAKSLLLLRPITLAIALVIALVGGLASAFFSLTRISPPALECPADGPRTRPRPRPKANRRVSIPPAVDEPRGWLGFARRKRAPLSSPPHSLRLSTMTPHDLANVTESDEEDAEMESMTADHESESDGPSEVDTVEDAATSPTGSQKGKAKNTAGGFFWRRPKRGVSDSSSEVAPEDVAPVIKGLSSLSAKACVHKGRSATSPPPTPPASSLSPTTSNSTSTASTRTSSRKPSHSRPPIHSSQSTPLLSCEPDSYLLPPRVPDALAHISRTNSFPTSIAQPGRRRFTFKNTFRSRSPLSSPPASPQLSPTLPPKSLSALAVDLEEEQRGEREASPGSPDTSGRSGLTLGDIAPARQAR